MAPRRVLIAIDWSEFSEQAFDYYIYNLHRAGTKLIMTYYLESDNDADRMKNTELQEVYESRLLQLKIEYQWVIGQGSAPGKHIVQLSQEHDVDLIVMGARGVSKLKKAILGSVSDYVLQKCLRPVLIVRRQ